jgi:hypothetical protein
MENRIGPWRRETEYSIEHQCFTTCFYRSEIFNGQKHMWNVMFIHDKSWEALEPGLRNFYKEEAEAQFEHRDHTGLPNWIIPESDKWEWGGGYGA